MNIEGVTGLRVHVRTRLGTMTTLFPVMGINTNAESNILTVNYLEAPEHNTVAIRSWLCGEWDYVEVEA